MFVALLVEKIISICETIEILKMCHFIVFTLPLCCKAMLEKISEYEVQCPMRYIYHPPPTF